MIGIVVAAHGGLAQALIDTARQVVRGELLIEAVPIGASDDSATFGERLRIAVQRVRGSDGVMVLTDMFGGTPANVGLTMHEPRAVEVLTGVNLPMVIKAMQLAERGVDLVAAAVQVKATGKLAISVASEVLAVPAPAADASGEERPS